MPSGPRFYLKRGVYFKARSLPVFFIPSNKTHNWSVVIWWCITVYQINMWDPNLWLSWVSSPCVGFLSSRIPLNYIPHFVPPPTTPWTHAFFYPVCFCSVISTNGALCHKSWEIFFYVVGSGSITLSVTLPVKTYQSGYTYFKCLLYTSLSAEALQKQKICLD